VTYLVPNEGRLQATVWSGGAMFDLQRRTATTPAGLVVTCDSRGRDKRAQARQFFRAGTRCNAKGAWWLGPAHWSTALRSLRTALSRRSRGFRL
jgi:hypothetical protein